MRRALRSKRTLHRRPDAILALLYQGEHTETQPAAQAGTAEPVCVTDVSGRREGSPGRWRRPGSRARPRRWAGRALAAGRMGVSEWMRVSAWSFMMPCNEGLTPVVHKDNSRARRGAVHEARACREDSCVRVDNRNLPLIDEYQSRQHVAAFAFANGCVSRMWHPTLPE